MKILEIIFHLASGGAERFAVDLSNELAKSNDVTLLTLRDDSVNPEVRNFYKDDITSNVRYECLRLKDGLRPSMWWKIWKAIRLNNPDVVHYHGGRMPYWMVVPMFFSSKDIKFVQTIHNDIHNGYDKGLYPLMSKTLGRRGILRYVALSDTNYKELKKVYPMCMSAGIVNGRAPMIPTLAFDEVKNEFAKFKNTPNTKIFLHVARCHEVKNQRRLIVGFNHLVENGADAQLLIVGDGFDSNLGNELRSIAGENVHFLGPRKNISDYHLCADAFCLSSDFEGMPITLLEALLCGTPACCTPVCGAVDVIRDDENGVLAKDFSDSQYFEAMERMYSNIVKYKANAQSQKESCQYTIKKCAENYFDFFNS